MTTETPHFEIDEYRTETPDTDPIRYPLPGDAPDGTPTVQVHFPNGDCVTLHPDRVGLADGEVVVDLPGLEAAAFDLRFGFDDE